MAKKSLSDPLHTAVFSTWTEVTNTRLRRETYGETWFRSSNRRAFSKRFLRENKNFFIYIYIWNAPATTAVFKPFFSRQTHPQSDGSRSSTCGCTVGRPYGLFIFRFFFSLSLIFDDRPLWSAAVVVSPRTVGRKKKNPTTTMPHVERARAHNAVFITKITDGGGESEERRHGGVLNSSYCFNNRCGKTVVSYYYRRGRRDSFAAACRLSERKSRTWRITKKKNKNIYLYISPRDCVILSTNARAYRIVAAHGVRRTRTRRARPPIDGGRSHQRAQLVLLLLLWGISCT